ncbi:MAG: hypothetical protein JWN04_3525 [Myxococcaceae bacterium]|nr:hypothetical protein [Myxococcaceae bacterium]
MPQGQDSVVGPLPLSPLVATRAGSRRYRSDPPPDPARVQQTQANVEATRTTEYIRRGFAGISFLFALWMAGHVVWWSMESMSRPIPGYVEGRGYQLGVYDWRMGLGRAALVLAALAFCGVLLRFVERMSLRTETVAQIETSRARSGKGESSSDAKMGELVYKLLEKLLAKLDSK